MPKYDIEVIAWETFTVEARDEYEAKTKAVQMAKEHDWSERLDFLFNDPDLGAIGEVEEVEEKGQHETNGILAAMWEEL